MVTGEEVEEVLPFSIKLEICCDSEEFYHATGSSLEELTERHNKKYDTKIEGVTCHFVDECDEIYDLSLNEFEIYVGHKLVFKGKGPEFSWEDKNGLNDFYLSIIPIVESVLDTWHDEIIRVEEENRRLLEQYEIDRYYEMLYSYYYIHSDKKAFVYLKKLGSRYKYGYYGSRYRLVYRTGYRQWHKINIKLFRKMEMGKKDHIF